MMPDFGRNERAGAEQLRFERARRIAANQLESFDAVVKPLRQNRFDLAKLRGVSGHDQLAALLVGDAVRGAEFIEHAPSARRMAGTQRSGRIIEAAVDHLAVARGYPIADAAGRLGDDHVMAATRGRPRDGEPDHTCANDENLHRSISRPRLFYCVNREGGLSHDGK